jgi:hypothetical protein
MLGDDFRVLDDGFQVFDDGFQAIEQPESTQSDYSLT